MRQMLWHIYIRKNIQAFHKIFLSNWMLRKIILIRVLNLRLSSERIQLDVFMHAGSVTRWFRLHVLQKLVIRTNLFPSEHKSFVVDRQFSKYSSFRNQSSIPNCARNDFCRIVAEFVLSSTLFPVTSSEVLNYGI